MNMRISARKVGLLLTVQAFLFFIIFLSADLYAQTGHIYWAEEYDGVIKRSNLDGDGIQEVVRATFILPQNAAIDASQGKMYWVDYYRGEMQRCNLDGSMLESVLTSGAALAGIAIDADAGIIYFRNGNKLEHVGMDGANPTEIIQLEGPFYSEIGDLVLDAAAGMLYLAHAGKIVRVHTDGTGLTDIVDPGGATIPIGIVLHKETNTLYWVSTDRKLRKAALDGSGMEELATITSYATDLELAPTSGFLYVATTKGVVRVNLDGSNVQQIVPESLVVRTVSLLPDESMLYWSGPNGIMRSLPNGDAIEELVFTPFTQPTELVFDPEARKLFWIDDGSNRVQWANLDGSDVEDLFVGDSAVRGLATAHGKVYWSHRSNMHRSGFGDGVIEELAEVAAVGGIAIDGDANKVYWTEWNTGKIRASNLDGTSDGDLLTGLTSPQGVAIDPQNSRLYWTDSSDHATYRAGLDGSTIEQIVVDQRSPRGIAVDPVGSKIYWAELDAGKIRRANLDGTDAEDLVVGLQGPHGIALDMAAYALSELEIPDAREPRLLSSFPNPSAGSTTISYQLNTRTHVRLEVIDLMGRRIAVLADEEVSPGMHDVIWDQNEANTQSGMYFLRLVWPDGSDVHGVTILR